MATQLKPEALQDILEMKEPYRTERIHEWVDEFSLEDGDTVLLKPAQGSGMKVMVNGKSMNFPPRGQKVGRRRALALMRDYGPKGKYIGMDRTTGMTKAQFATMKPEDKERWKDYEFDFNENYLIHVPSEQDEVEETENNG